MSKPCVILLGAEITSVRAAQEEGFSVLLIQQKKNLDISAIELADETIVADYEQSEKIFPLLRCITMQRPVAGVWSFTEYGLLPAALYAQALGVNGQSVQSVHITRNKYAMREKLKEIGISPVKYALCYNVEQAIQFCSQIGYPALFKAVDGFHKLGVQLVCSEEDVRVYFPAVQKDINNQMILVEEYLEGPELSVEGLVIDNIPYIVTLTDKEYIAPTFNEVAHSVPSRLPTTVQDEVKSITSAFITAIGYQMGIFHFEFRLTSSGPRLIEGHTRPGGDRVWDLIRMAFGLDIYRAFFQVLSGQRQRLDVSPNGGGAIRFFLPQPGYVKSINNVQEASIIPGIVELNVNVKPGDVTPIPKTNYDRSGYVIAIGRTADEAVARAQAAHDRIQFHIVTESPSMRLVESLV
jgi:biotin carboxylase